MSRRIGPITLEVAPAPAAGEGPSHSGTYRNIAAAEGLPDTFLGCATLYELFNKSVEQYGSNRCVQM